MPQPKKLTSYSFPPDFLWGASVAGHQVEGGNYDQWTVWELDNAAELAATAADRLRWVPSWLKIKKQAENPDNYVSGKGIDHLHRYKEDFRIAKKIGLNAFRFSIEWSRIEPDKGVWDKKAIDHYHNYIAALKAEGLEPILNLWHWTSPVWFENEGGFAKARNLERFARFVKKVGEEFGADINYVLTINEPNVYSTFSYMTGEWVPNDKNVIKAHYVFYNLARAHRQAYRILKQLHPHLWVGIATQFTNAQPKKKDSWLDKTAARWSEYYWNWWYVDRTRRHLDFIGFNYYFTNYYDGLKTDNPAKPVNDLGWYMDPAGLSDMSVKAWLRYKKPLMVTENGVADMDDKYRKWWLKETMEALSTARKAGADVFGYLHWSLLDNFEWKYGWWPKFGLIKVDRDRNMKRLVRPSAIWWSQELKKLRNH
jgi:beta-glucosidase